MPSENGCEALNLAAGKEQPLGTADGTSMVDRRRGQGGETGNADGRRREGNGYI